MHRLIVANWKHNPTSLDAALALAGAESAVSAQEVEVVICPPTAYLAPIRAAHPDLVLGAQDVSAVPQGAYTGETGTAILADLGVRYAIVGHSERRAMGESDEDVTAKILAATAAGITPILCVGEDADVRAQGEDAVHAFLQEQLGALSGQAEAIVAYEPIWAIGTGNADEPESAAKTAAWIIEYLGYLDTKARVLYGGSTNPDNAAAFLAQENISGLLVGGASLDPAKLGAMVAGR